MRNSPKEVKNPNLLLKSKQTIFWDFDGVIKDSVEAKSLGYEQLFINHGSEVANRVRKHHEANGGISRYEKIPIYLKWAGEPASENQVQEYCGRFSDFAQQAVVDSPWVPGIRKYLEANHSHQYFVLITATPQKEIEQILDILDISQFFREVHGAPTPKAVAISNVLKQLKCHSEQSLVVGDSETDLKAAETNNVTFLLRRTSLNQDLQQRFQGPSFKTLKI
jgi:phosphoglycolate phosphatase-like HAD superfamily hydrolase